jgi:succinate dehydrogenase / fumarate reductase membrane anchor subunit
MSWLVVSLLMLPEYSHETVSAWLAQPLSAVAMILLIANLFWHARMGLTVLIEDYIHEAGSKFGLLAGLNMAAIGGAAFGIFSVASLALGVQG